MTLANPAVVTINAVGKTLVKINTDNYGSHYRLVEATQRFDLKIRHAAEKPTKLGVVMDRHNVELTQTVFSTDPDVADTVYQSYVIIRNPSTKTGVETPYLAHGLADYLNISGAVADLVAWQN